MNISTRHKTIKITHILKDNDNWECFKTNILPQKVPGDMREDVIEQVERALGCGDPRNGFTKYKCVECGHEHMIGFTCKSRFCSKCGKKYIDNWVNKQVENILDVGHRHVIFTVPDDFRGYVFWHRDILKDMCDGVAEVIQGYYAQKSKTRQYEFGIIAVVHTFGRDVGFNPHVHALVTEGAIDEYKQWKDVPYISYEYLRKAWQKVLMDIFKRKFPQDQKVKNLINKCYAKRESGLYVNAEKRMTNARSAAKYIGRYLARPAIAEYRIIEYTGNKVTFLYDDHKTGKREKMTLSVPQFIGRVIMHVPKKNFLMVRRYGLYRRNFNKRAQKIVSLWKYMKNRQIKLLNEERKLRNKRWRERIIESFGHDPLRCEKCKGEMILFEIWSPKHDFVYHAWHTDEKGKFVKRFIWEEDPRNARRQGFRITGIAIPFPG